MFFCDAKLQLFLLQAKLLHSKFDNSEILSYLCHKEQLFISDNIMNRLIFSIAVLITASSIAPDAYSRSQYNTGETNEMFIESVKSDQAVRNAKREILSTKKHLLDSVITWTCGVQAFQTVYDKIDHRIALHLYGEYDGKMGNPIADNKVIGKQVVSKSIKGAKYSVERLGNYVMLVERNAAGVPIKAFYKIEPNDIQSDRRYVFLRRVLAGNYVLENGKHALFGPKMEHYSDMKWAGDPGARYRLTINEDHKSFDIEYGEGRVSHGDPSSPKYGKMPGGGGAGALMGPMTIRVTPILGGLNVTTIHDQKFVDHNPRFGENVTLSIVETPYAEIPGKYGVASAMPLTHSILRLLPKDVLKMMRCEIYARHGDTFTEAEVQDYFNAQPWYKKSVKVVVLTDIERFNVAFIKQIEKEK